MESFLKGRLLYKKDNGKKFYAIKIPSGDKETGKITYKDYFIIKTKNDLGSKEKYSYNLLCKDGKKRPIIAENDSFKLELEDNTTLNLSFDDDKALFSHNNKSEDLIVINYKKDKVKSFIYYLDGSKKDIIEYRKFDDNIPEIKRYFKKENDEYKLQNLQIFKDNKIAISSNFKDNIEYRKEFRKDGSLKYLTKLDVVDLDDLSQNETISTEIYLQSPLESEIKVQKNLITFKDLKTQEKTTLYLSDNQSKVLEIEPNDKEKSKKIINNIFNNFLNKIDFANDTMTQELANAYIFANLDEKKSFLNFDIDNQLQTLTEFQDRYFTKNDKSDFKVGIITNNERNHAMCLVLPNPYIYPKEKAILIDSSFVKDIKMKNGLYTDLNPELAKDIRVVNSKNIQHGASCVLYSIGIAQLLSQKKSFLDVRKTFADTKACDLFNIPTSFEKEVSEKIPQMFDIKNKIEDKYGTGLVNNVFIKDLKRRAEIEKKHREKLNNLTKTKMKKIEKKLRKTKTRTSFRNLLRNRHKNKHNIGNINPCR